MTIAIRQFMTREELLRRSEDARPRPREGRDDMISEAVSQSNSIGL